MLKRISPSIAMISCAEEDTILLLSYLLHLQCVIHMLAVPSLTRVC